MCKRALWPVAKHKGSTSDTPLKHASMSAHKDSSMEYYVVLLFMKKECGNNPIFIQEVVTGDNKEYWAPT